MTEGVEGLGRSVQLFDGLPGATREELAVELAILSRKILLAQKRDVAKDTGALGAGLSLLMDVERLRVRVGLIGVKARSKSAIRRARKAGQAIGESFGDLFYGRIVEFGRRAQTVLVQRRQRVGGRLRTQSRGSRKRAEDIVATYSLKVKAREARPFVLKDRPETSDAQQWADFWSSSIARAEGKA